MKILQLYILGLVIIFGFYIFRKISYDSEILVDLKQEVQPSILNYYLKEYELKFDKIVSSYSNIVLYTFNNEKISAVELVVKVKQFKEKNTLC